MSEAPPPDDVLSVFDALEAASVHYLVWKDVQEVDLFEAGDAELDLLVPSADRERFSEVAREHGFAEYRNLVDLYEGHITHYIRFHAGKHYHLHVHDSLLTGDHVAKEYCLDDLLGERPGGVMHGRIRTVSPEDELLIGLCRLALKSAAVDGIKAEELQRLRSIHTPALFDAAAERLRMSLSVLPEELEALRALVEGREQEAAVIAGIAERFDPWRRMSRPRVRSTRVAERALRAASRLLGLSNKTLRARAPSISIVGVDGSGKSTLAERLHAIVDKKTSCRYVYLGGNTKTYGVASWSARMLWGASAVSRRALGGAAGTSDLYYVLQALFEYSKCRDRVRRIDRANRFARRGVIHVFERYPMKGLFDYPFLADELERGAVQMGAPAKAIVTRLLARIDAELGRAGRPDIIVLVDTPFDVIASRRELDEPETRDIQKKLDLLHRYGDRGAEAGIFVLDNRGSLDESIATICEVLNGELCSSSS
ncbi:MAG: hypothetical protein OXT09_23470 [Myxococcales bacterium]|nr:hypothetical protein [Myxococcales bacterium]